MDIAVCTIDIFGASRHSFPEVVQANPPPGTVWTLEWHEILHQWNVRMNIFLDKTNIKTWLHICCLSYWSLSQHIATVPQERWIRRILRWCPAGRYRTGRPHFHWDSNMDYYCGYKAQAGGLRPLRMETFGINIPNFSSNFPVHTTTGLNFLQIYHMEWVHFAPAP